MNAPVSLVGASVIDELVKTAKKTPAGCFVEVGVYKGGTAWHLAKLAEIQNRKIFLFDTFTGIPYKGEFDPVVVGTFNETSFDDVRCAIPYATIVQGIFPQSVEEKEIDLPPIAFVHLDCDQYQSIREAVIFLSPQMVSGGVMWFDDYACLEGATKAVDELFFGRIETSLVGKAFVRF
jgi:O-methyltransferase